MRVAYVGNFRPEWSTENDVRLAFEALGHEVVRLQEDKMSAGQLRSEALASDLLLWTGTWGDAIDLRDALDVFHACAREGIPTATYHLDTFWVTSRGGRKWWREPMFHTAHVFTADGDHQDEWERLGVNHHWLRPGLRHTATTPGTFREEFACDVAFVGSNGDGYHEDVWTYRKELLAALREMCARNGWSFRNPGGDDPKVDRGSMCDFYASAKVTVGDSLCPRQDASHYWSDRAYEAPGRGGLLIMPDLEVLANDYYRQLPMYHWGNWSHLERQVKGLLEDEKERESVRRTCHRIAAERHTYVNRMQELLDVVGFHQSAWYPALPEKMENENDPLIASGTAALRKASGQ